MKRRFLSLILVGFFLVLDLGGWTQHIQANPTFSDYSGEIQGEIAYQQGQWDLAVDHWRAALENLENKQDIPAKGRILSKLALAYGKWGQWNLAEQAIAQSLNTLEQQPDSQTLAQVYNNWGNLELMRGFGQKALNHWQIAEEFYQKAQDQEGILLSQINQARAFKVLGRFRLSCNKLLKTLDFNLESCDDLTLDSLSFSLESVKSPLEGTLLSAWLTLADVLRKLGQFQESLLIISTIQPMISANTPQGDLWLNVGKTLQLQGQKENAFIAYQKVLAEASPLSVKLEAELLQLNLLLSKKPPKIAEAITLLSPIEQQLKTLPISHSQIEQTFNYIYQLIRLKSLNLPENQVPSWDQILTLAHNTLTQAKSLGDQRSISYALGILGKIEEKRQQRSTAKQLTTQALTLAESINAPEIVYLWQWQLGRILAQKQERTAAIQAYRNAIATHRRITAEIAANREAQFSFQETGENLYREAVSLLLQPTEGSQPSQADLIEARQVMESLQIASLNNFFRDNCLESSENIDLNRRNNDPTAAIIYPIMLSDRLAIIVSLANKPLYYYETPVSHSKLEQTIEKFRYTLVIRSRWDFLPFGAQLYDWLIRPYEAILEEMGIKTLVFVPDIDLRNIPLSSLVSDPINRHYLIEQYQIVVTPSLELFPPVKTNLQPLSVLLGGITVEQDGNIALPYVGQEINNIQPLIASDSLILKNEQLNFQNLEQAFRDSNFPVVHLATHGVFSSNFEDTYLVIWQNYLNIRQLGNLLELNRLQRDKAIELLVLSACETATGDQRAALGLAGMAVRSGARSTLATLWSVNDEGTAYLMQKFYKNLADVSQKPSKAGALQLAQLELLKDQWYNHPFYWSPFVLVGNCQ